MKITFFASGSVRSNFSYRILALARSLHKLGHEVSIVAPSADKYNNFIPEKIEAIDGVRILQPFQFTTHRLEINLFPYLFGAAQILFKERPDLVYIYKPTPVSIVGLLAKLFWKTPVITDMDDLGSEVMKIEGHPFHQRKLVEWSEHMATSYADKLVLASTYLFNIFHQRFPDKPVYLMSNGVDPEWFNESLTMETQKRIVFLGSLNRITILDPLFDILPDLLKQIPEAQVLIIGDGKYLQYFKDKSEKLKINDYVTFTGWLELSKARSQLHMGDIGYNYMPREKTVIAASNMKTPQYMSRGVIPIVSDVSDLLSAPDFKNASYAANANDLASLRTVLESALKDPDRLKKAKNAQAFSVKTFSWDTLALGFHRWITSRHDTGRIKLYTVSTTVPDVIGGGELRNYNLIKQLAKQPGMDIETFCISPRDREVDRKLFESSLRARCHIVGNATRTPLTMMRAIFGERVTPYMDDFKSSGVGDVFRKACEESIPDFVQIEQLDAYYCIRPHISWLKKNGVKIIFDCHNIEFQVLKDSLKLFSLPKKLAGNYIIPNLERLEIEAIKAADIVFACSKHDADFFSHYNSRTYVVPNGVDCSLLHPNTGNEAPILIFMGGVAYPPNGDAMEFYLNLVHPLIKAKMPGIELLAIGTSAEWLDSKNIHDQTITPLGFVDDVRPYLERALIGICPLRYGSGTRIKIMTYMAAGLPVVSTTKGAEGVPYVNGHDISIADDPQNFADAVLAFLRNPAYRDTIAKNGRGFVLKNYDWNVIGESLKSIYIK